MTDKIKNGVGTMILSMEKKFDECGIYWNHDNGGWMKTVVNLNKAKKNGYSLVGDFVNAGIKKGDYDVGLYLNCNKFDNHVVYQLVKLHEDGGIELLQELVDPGRGWAVELWEKIDENLDDNVVRPTYPDSFLNYEHLKAYLLYAGYAELPKSTFEEGSEVFKDKDFYLPDELTDKKIYVEMVQSVFFSKHDLNAIKYKAIENVNALLNLSYLDSLKSDGVGIYVDIGRFILLFSVKGDDFCVRWFNHTL